MKASRGTGRWAVVGLCALAVACNALPGRATLLTVDVDFDAGQRIDQLEFTGATAASHVFGPTARPSPAGAALASPQSVRVELSSDLDGQELTVDVRGLAGGVAVAAGTGVRHISGGTAMELEVSLAPISLPTDGGPGDGGCSDCAGCCLGGECLTATFPLCGEAGADCAVCDANLGDRCAGGGCACGDGPACSGTTVDRCASGSCVCGTTGAPCPADQECVNGACHCTATSCPDGCCNGTDHCQTPSFSACGEQGRACITCPASNSDACVSGTCMCGDGGACGAGQQCVLGQCRCTPASCPSGCCSNDLCVPGDQPSACGAAGQACQQCPGGESCAGGACSGCNAASCDGGCCSGASCIAPPTFSDCGSGGAACAFCPPDRADTCLPSGCSCGSSGLCALGEVCADGGCTQGAGCTLTTCPNGCCTAAGLCDTAYTTGSCGAPGTACAACDPTFADACNAAGCYCSGTTSACSTGQRCVPGTGCVCDATSCPDGCCKNGKCQAGDQKSACGVGGEICASCTGSFACVDGGCQ